MRGEVCGCPGWVAGGDGVEGGVGGRRAAAGEQLASCRSWGAAAGAARHGQVGQRAVVPRRRGAAQGEARAGRGTCSKLAQSKLAKSKFITLVHLKQVGSQTTSM